MKSSGEGREGERGGGRDTVTNESDYKLHFPALILIRLSFLSPSPSLPPIRRIRADG